MNKFYALLILVILLLLFTQNYEHFSLDNSNENNELKQLFLNNIQSKMDNNMDNKMKNDIIIGFNNSQKLNIAERLPAFKTNIVNIINNEKLIDSLYFDLRMNDNVNIRNKLITGYLYINSVMKENKIGNMVLTDDIKEKILITMKEWSAK